MLLQRFMHANVAAGVSVAQRINLFLCTRAGGAENVAPNLLGAIAE